MISISVSYKQYSALAIFDDEKGVFNCDVVGLGGVSFVAKDEESIKPELEVVVEKYIKEYHKKNPPIDLELAMSEAEWLSAPGIIGTRLAYVNDEGHHVISNIPLVIAALRNEVIKLRGD